MFNTKLICLFISIGIFSITAEAGDAKIFPGAMCETTAVYVSQPLTRSGGTVKNNTSGYLEVVCPIVKDKTDEQTINSAEIWVRNPYGNVSCTAKAVKATGAVYGTARTISSSSSYRKLTLVKVDSNANDSSYIVTCNLSRGASISMYKFSE